MLPDSYSWNITEDMANLSLRYGCVATVRRDGDGFKLKVKQTAGREITGRCGSLKQGIRYAERIIEAQSHPKTKKRSRIGPSQPILEEDKAFWRLCTMGSTRQQVPMNQVHSPMPDLDMETTTYLNEVFESL